MRILLETCILLIVFLPFGFGLASWLIGKKSQSGRDGFALAAAFTELGLSLVLLTCTLKGFGPVAGEGSLIGKETFCFQLEGVFVSGISFQTDGFRAVYALVTALMWAFTTLFSMEYFKNEREHLNRYYAFVLMTLGATQGVMLSGDLITTYLFFELLSLTSFTWVIHEETKKAVRAAYTYLFIAIIGGLVLFFGLVLLQDAAGTLSFAQLPEALRETGTVRVRTAGLCILLGFGCKAGMFPMHVWLPKAHPVAPSPASALLSGILTKVGIYGILMTTLQVMLHDAVYGWTVLILGTITMLLGAVLALFSVNLKRTLACSSMSQIGFILTGIGTAVLLTARDCGLSGAGAAGLSDSALTALSGSLLHMVNHSMLKLSLFCAAGVIVMNIHALDLNEIRGYGRNKTTLKIAFALGLLGISGVPLFNGYASKTLLHEGITAAVSGEAASGAAGAVFGGTGILLLKIIEWTFLISGGCTLAYMLKLFLCIFVEKNADKARQALYDRSGRCMNKASSCSVLGTSLLFIVLGQKPVYGAIAAVMTGKAGVLDQFQPFSLSSLGGGLLSVGIGTGIYLVLVRGMLMKDGSYVDRWPEKLDLEELFYRPLLTKWLPAVFGPVAAVFGENRVLIPACRGVFFAGAFIGRCMATGTDGLIVLLRRTVVSERRVTGKRQERLNSLNWKRQELERAYQPIVQNFSFALMVSCIGILVIFVVLAVYVAGIWRGV